MGVKSMILGAFGGAVTIGVLDAGLSALSGAVGAAILKSDGYDNYDPLEGAQMGAIGGAVLGSASGLISGALTGCGFFKKEEEKSKASSGTICQQAVLYSAGMVLSGMTGYGIMNVSHELIMDLGKTAAAFAVGGAVTMLPVACVFVCLWLLWRQHLWQH